MITLIQNMDLKIMELINKKLKNRILDRIMPIITFLGNGGTVWLIIAFYLIKGRNYKIEGYMVICALIITTIMGEGILKHLIRRARPFINNVEEKLLISKPITYSFPSGHTASSFASAGIIIIMGNHLGVLAIILAFLIAFSRIYLNVHYPTDVIIGIILGLICSRLVISLFSSEAIRHLNL